MKKAEKSVFSMQETANELKMPRCKLFKFLRRYRIIENSKVQPEFLFLEYFEQGTATISYGASGSKQVDKVYVTGKGVEFIKKLMKLLTPTL